MLSIVIYILERDTDISGDFLARGSNMKEIRTKFAARLIELVVLLALSFMVSAASPSTVSAQMQQWFQQEQARQMAERQQWMAWQRQEQMRQMYERNQWLQFQQQEMMRQRFSR